MATASTRHTASVLAACVLWGTTGTVAHYAPAGSSATLIGLSTFGVGALILYAVDARSTTRLLRDRSARGALAAGAVGVILYASMYYASMARVGVAIGNVLALGSGPVFAALLELVLDRRRVRLPWLLATGVAVVGMGLLAYGAHAAPGHSPVVGVLLALGAGFGYAVYSYAGSRLIAAGAPSRAVMASMFVLAAVVLLPWFVLGRPGPLLSGRGLVVLGYLAVLPMAAAYLLFGYGLRALAASTATTLALAEPLVATLLAVVVVGEVLTVGSWVGLGLILVGIVVVAVTERRGGPETPPDLL